MKIQTSLFAALFCLGVIAPTNASAILIGDEVTFRFTDLAGRNVSDSEVAVGGSGPELVLDIFGNRARFFNADVEASQIMIGYSGFPTAFASGQETLTFESVDWIDDPTGFIIGVTLDNTTVSGLTQSDITFGPHTITLDITGLTWQAGDKALLSIDAQHNASVPDGGHTGVLFGLGLLCLVGATRRWAHSKA